MDTNSWVWEIPNQPIKFIVSRIRRESHELIGELTVICNLPGALTIGDGQLSVADMNFSSLTARQARAKFLTQRSQTNGHCDWLGWIENFSQQVIQKEREGDPSIDLRTVPLPPPGDDLKINGLVMPRRHPTILFGDGGAAKSYTALYIAGMLAKDGLNVAFFDWELEKEDHRIRLGLLFGADMPPLRYNKCKRPLIYEIDSLRRTVRDHAIDFAIFDSIAFACDGPPESAEIAGKYFRAVREIGCGSLHNAHINRSESNDQKPFGSAFWHNGARSTWFVQADQEEPTTLRLGFFNRKANLGPLAPAFSCLVSFHPHSTTFDEIDINECPDFAAKQTISQRLYPLLKRGSMPISELATLLDAKENTIYITAKRNRKFILLNGGRIGLRE